MNEVFQFSKSKLAIELRWVILKLIISLIFRSVYTPSEKLNQSVVVFLWCSVIAYFLLKYQLNTTLQPLWYCHTIFTFYCDFVCLRLRNNIASCFFYKTYIQNHHYFKNIFYCTQTSRLGATRRCNCFLVWNINYES